MKGDLVVLGAGGTSLDFCEAAAAAGYSVLGILDDAVGGEIGGYPVLGRLERWRELPEQVRFFCGIGSTSSHRTRLDLINGLRIPDARWATIVHPAAVVSPTAVIGHGCGILALSTLGARVVLGPHVEVLQLCLVAHDCRIDAAAILAGGANLAGGAHVGACAYVGAGAMVRNGLRVGAGALLGMNSTLTVDLPAGAVYAGTPARELRTAGRA